MAANILKYYTHGYFKSYWTRHSIMLLSVLIMNYVLTIIIYFFIEA